MYIREIYTYIQRERERDVNKKNVPRKLPCKIKKKKHLPAGPGSAGSWMEVGDPINENNSAVDIFNKFTSLHGQS